MFKMTNKDFLKTGFFALIVATVLLLVVFEIQKFKAEEDVREVKDRVLPIEPEAVNKVSFKSHVLIRDFDDGVWLLVDPVSDYLNFGAVEDWLAKTLSFDGRKLSDADENVRWADFGFSDSLPAIEIFEKKNKHSLVLSEKTAFDGSLYLKYQKNNESPVLVSSDPDWANTFKLSPKEFRSLKVFDWTVPQPSSQVKTVKIKKGSRDLLSLYKEKDLWKSSRHKLWSFDQVRVEAFLSDLQQYLHKGFAESQMRLGTPKLSLYIEDQNNKGFSVNIYSKDKKIYAVASYRPEHVLKLDKEAFDDFEEKEINFREFSDLIKDFKIENVQALKIRKDGENKVFRLRDGIWKKTDGKKIPKGFEFNGAKVFKLLEKFKAVQYKRYISEKDIIFKSAKKKLYFYKDQKNIEYTYTVGQGHPCSQRSKGAYKCVLVATNKVQGFYGVALRSDVQDLFKIGFIQKSPEKMKLQKTKDEETK